MRRADGLPGLEVKRRPTGFADLHFDPILHHGDERKVVLLDPTRVDHAILHRSTIGQKERLPPIAGVRSPAAVLLEKFPARGIGKRIGRIKRRGDDAKRVHGVFTRPGKLDPAAVREMRVAAQKHHVVDPAPRNQGEEVAQLVAKAVPAVRALAPLVVFQERDHDA